MFAVYNTYELYLSSKRVELWGFYPETLVVGEFMKNNDKFYNFYLTDNFPRDTLTYLTYKTGDPFIKNYEWFENKEDLLDVGLKNDKKNVFIMFDTKNNLQFINKLKVEYPEGKIGKLKYVDDNINRSAALLFIVN